MKSSPCIGLVAAALVIGVLTGCERPREERSEAKISERPASDLPRSPNKNESPQPLSQANANAAEARERLDRALGELNKATDSAQQSVETVTAASREKIGHSDADAVIRDFGKLIDDAAAAFKDGFSREKFEPARARAAELLKQGRETLPKLTPEQREKFNAALEALRRQWGETVKRATLSAASEKVKEVFGHLRRQPRSTQSTISQR